LGKKSDPNSIIQHPIRTLVPKFKQPIIIGLMQTVREIGLPFDAVVSVDMTSPIYSSCMRPYGSDYILFTPNIYYYDY
jgi:hypothetical protein